MFRLLSLFRLRIVCLRFSRVCDSSLLRLYFVPSNISLVFALYLPLRVLWVSFCLMKQIVFRHLKPYKIPHIITKHKKRYFLIMKKTEIIDKNSLLKLQCRVWIYSHMRITAGRILKNLNRGYHINYIMKTEFERLG